MIAYANLVTYGGIQVIEGRKSELVQNPALLGTVDPESMTNLNNKKPFLDLLLYHHMVTGELTLEDIEDEVNTFLFEGHDTTASGLSFTIYLLGLHPDIQEKVRSEVLEHLGPLEQPMTPEGLKELRYLEMVIKESMRLYPPVMHFSRQLQSDIELGGKKIPKGVVIAVSPTGFHYNPTYFPSPEIFDPERFNLENSKKRHPFAYIPFSVGPRNCIDLVLGEVCGRFITVVCDEFFGITVQKLVETEGQKFAILEMKAVLASIVRRFSIKSRDHRDRLILTPEIVMTSTELVVNFEPLQTK
ncbi:CYP4V2 [Cordylochernes scorpioides]|uniref:CYP4V2 n=1 Tax=Cordylochernes scorpioides TaxID=51811 RepID=A0ABY6L9R5_9ARAC|nr:CYP4V2 [Cordylochernes scorpioides]